MNLTSFYTKEHLLNTNQTKTRTAWTTKKQRMWWWYCLGVCFSVFSTIWKVNWLFLAPWPSIHKVLPCYLIPFESYAPLCVRPRPLPHPIVANCHEKLITPCCERPLPVVHNLFAVKDPQIAAHQAREPYLIRCSLRDPIWSDLLIPLLSVL